MYNLFMHNTCISTLGVPLYYSLHLSQAFGEGGQELV